MTILTKQYEFKNVDWTIAGGGEARDGNTAVSLGGVSGTIKFAFLYWGELDFSGSSDNVINFNGNTVVGGRLGTSVDTCWGSDHSVGYFADVTNYVSGNGTFSISGMGEGGQGASLVVFYDDGDVTNNRDVTLYAGNDATNAGGAITNINLGNIEYDSGDVNVTLSVGDGQWYSDGTLRVNGTSVGSNLFSGATGEMGSFTSDSLWDVVSVDISSLLSVGSNNVHITHQTVEDCLQFVSVIVDKPSAPPVLFLDFNTAIPLDFHVKTGNFFGFGNKEGIGQKSGSDPIGQFSESQKAQLVELVQDIFDRSGIAMEVTSTQPSDGEYHTVRFSSEKLIYDSNGDGVDDARLLGQAYEGVDRFNSDKSNIVAVFMDGSDPLLAVAGTTAHEAAHAFGVRHINPIEGSGTEVMDYDDSGLQTFFNEPAYIIEPPVDGQAPTSVTHNPAYHIRRYVNDESDEQLRLEGIEPGTWDRSFFNNILYSIGIVDLTDGLSSISLVVSGAGDQVDGNVAGALGKLILLAENVSQGQTISFSLPEGTAFKIVASSGDDAVIDVVMEFDPSSNDPFTTIAGQSSSISGSFVAGETEGERANVGSFSMTVTGVESVYDEAETPELLVTIDKRYIYESGETATVTISRGANVTGDLVVTLVSNDTSEAYVPNEIVIPDGQSEVEVVLQALNDYLLDGTQIVTITALAEGYGNGIATIKVLDDETDYDTASDLTGDGTSDILWHHAGTNAVGMFAMDTSVPTFVDLGGGGPGWVIVGTGDLTGDGTSDIVWNNTSTNAVGVFEMDTGTPVFVDLGGGGPGWAIAGIGDLTGDGTDDILWNNTGTNGLGMFRMDSGTPVFADVGSGGSGWTVAGVGDFTGDGTDDILWHHSGTNAVGMFEMDSGTPAFVDVSSAGAGWVIAGIGDFTGDGTDDILWNHTPSNAVGMFVMDSGSAVYMDVSIGGAGWAIAGVGDYTGDGTDDILWHEAATNAVGMFVMDSGAPVYADISTGGTGWELA